MWVSWNHLYLLFAPTFWAEIYGGVTERIHQLQSLGPDEHPLMFGVEPRWFVLKVHRLLQPTMYDDHEYLEGLELHQVGLTTKNGALRVSIDFELHRVV